MKDNFQQQLMDTLPNSEYLEKFCFCQIDGAPLFVKPSAFSGGDGQAEHLAAGQDTKKHEKSAVAQTARRRFW